MPLTPAEIKVKLINALDGDKKIIDEEAVEEVITLLETSAITKEILEQTRLGRDINVARKACKNPQLAKRAKNLVKSWKKLIEPCATFVANGQHPSQKVIPGLPSPALKNVQQQGIKSAGVKSPIGQPKVNQQVLHPSKLAQSDVKQKLIHGRKSPRPVSVAHTRLGIHLNEDSNLSWPQTPPSNLSDNSQDRLIGDPENGDSTGNKGHRTASDKRNFNFDNNSFHSSESTSKSVIRAPDQRDVSKTNVANRKRTRPPEFDNSHGSLVDFPLSKQLHIVSSQSLSTVKKNDVINGTVKKMNLKSPGINVRDIVNDTKVSSSRNSINDQSEVSMLASRGNQKFAPSRQDSLDSKLSVHSSDSRGYKEKPSKVKTTEQLIEDMQRKSSTNVGTNVIAQIRTRQIKNESDSQKSVSTSGAKRRGRKKKQDKELPDTEAVSDVRKLAQTKSEYIERFLRTSVAPIPGEDSFDHSLPHLRQDSLDDHHLALGGCSSTYYSGFSYSSRQDKPDSGPSASPPEARDISEVMGTTPLTSTTLEMTARLKEEQILACLPPIDYENIDWTMYDYPAPKQLPVTPKLVDGLHKDSISGLNGTYDRDSNFKKWHEMLTLDTAYGEQLHILPYVIVDD